MDFIKQWCASVCISLIVATVISMLSPRGSMNRFFKMMISVFIFISFLLPLQDFNGFEFDFSKIGITNGLAQSQNETVGSMLCTEIIATLEQNGIEGADVNCDVNYRADSGEIEISDVQIAVSDEYEVNAVKKLVFDELGINARVIKVGS
ncbi:MAG: hypothetical protein IKF64_01400 [Eubacterium sp.]|nr:hypothetical protein [Eubacterium sp.]